MNLLIEYSIDDVPIEKWNSLTDTKTTEGMFPIYNLKRIIE